MWVQAWRYTILPIRGPPLTFFLCFFWFGTLLHRSSKTRPVICLCPRDFSTCTQYPREHKLSETSEEGWTSQAEVVKIYPTHKTVWCGLNVRLSSTSFYLERIILTQDTRHCNVVATAEEWGFFFLPLSRSSTPTRPRKPIYSLYIYILESDIHEFFVEAEYPLVRIKERIVGVPEISRFPLFSCSFERYLVFFWRIGPASSTSTGVLLLGEFTSGKGSSVEVGQHTNRHLCTQTHTWSHPKKNKE